MAESMVADATGILGGNAGAALALFLLVMAAGFALGRWLHRGAEQAVLAALAGDDNLAGRDAAPVRAAWSARCRRA